MGVSQLIVDGKIRLKNDSHIFHSEEKTIVYEDGSTLPADIVIFVAGYGDPKQLVAELAGPEVESESSNGRSPSVSSGAGSPGMGPYALHGEPLAEHAYHNGARRGPAAYGMSQQQMPPPYPGPHGLLAGIRYSVQELLAYFPDRTSVA